MVPIESWSKSGPRGHQEVQHAEVWPPPSVSLMWGQKPEEGSQPSGGLWLMEPSRPAEDASHPDCV